MHQGVTAKERDVAHMLKIYYRFHSHFLGPQIVLLSDDMRVIIGDTTVLLCMTFEQMDQDITWLHNGDNVTNTSLVTVTGSDFVQDGVVFRQSFLRICNTSMSDTGLYTCIASNNVNASTQITAVTGKLGKKNVDFNELHCLYR